MPNWCNNDFTVTGKVKDLKRFVKNFHGKPAKWPVQDYELRNKTEEEKKQIIEDAELEYKNLEPKLCFNALYPVPDAIVAKGYSDAGYHWCANEWGTKWDIYCDEVELQEYYDEAENNEDEPRGQVSCYFSTAWAPPIEWLYKVAADYPELDFELGFEEIGCGFAGLATFSGGELVGQEEATSSDMDAFQKFLIDKRGYDEADMEDMFGSEEDEGEDE